MPEFFDYDPTTGVRTDFDYNHETGEVRLWHTQDIEPVLKLAAMSRQYALRDHGIKESWFNYAIIPETVMLEMHRKGIGVLRGDDSDRVYAEINTHYPHLKLTTKNEGGKVKQHFILSNDRPKNP